jgi:Lysylphosphatidylglycerol synthase TM region
MRIIFLIAGVGLLVYLTVRLGVGAIIQSLVGIGWGYLPLMALFVAYQLTRAAALAQAAPIPGLRFRSLVWTQLSGQAVQTLTFSGPFLAEPTRALLLARRGLTTSDAFAGVIAEYLVNTWLSAVLSVAGLVWIRANIALSGPVDAAARIIIIVMTAFLTASAVAIGFRIYLLGAIVAGLRRLPLVGGRLRIEPHDMRRMEDRLLHVLRDRPPRLLRTAGFDTLGQLLLIVEGWWILRALNVDAGLLTATLLEAATKFMSLAFFFIPGQVGAAEGTYVVAFDALGLPVAAGFAFAFVRRLRTLAVAGVGLLALSLAGGRKDTADDAADARRRPLP